MDKVKNGREERGGEQNDPFGAVGSSRLGLLQLSANQSVSIRRGESGLVV